MIKKYLTIITIIFSVMIVGTVVAIFERLYPVAIVNGSPIWYRTWDRYLQGTGHAFALQARVTGKQFDLDATVISVIKKDTLTALIEDRLLTQQGRIVFAQFDKRSDEHVFDAVGTSTNMGDAAKLLYGFSEADFHDFILLPASRREVAKESMDKQKIDFVTWLAGVKKRAHVQLLLNGYIWDGESVK